MVTLGAITDMFVVFWLAIAILAGAIIAMGVAIWLQHRRSRR